MCVFENSMLDSAITSVESPIAPTVGSFTGSGIGSFTGSGDGLDNEIANEAPKTKKKSASWVKKIFGLGPEHADMPSCRLIYPLSPFGVAWLGTTAFFLVYTAVVTPPMIAFHWLDQDCVNIPTLPVDVALDCFFLLDIIVNFNLGTIAGGELVDDHWQVAREYFRGSFMFDLCTSIPVSFFELKAQAVCDIVDAGGQGSGVDNTAQLRLIRAIKPLKIARLMKLGKSTAVITVLMDYYEISPKQGKTLQVLGSLVGVVHLMGCIFWLWKVLAAGAPRSAEKP